MIVDFHAHVFPPQVATGARSTCGGMLPSASSTATHRSKLASAEEVLASMDEAGIDVSVIVGFAWGDIDLCRQTNDYILESDGSQRRTPGGLLLRPTPSAGDEAPRPEVAALRPRRGRLCGLGEAAPLEPGL